MAVPVLPNNNVVITAWLKDITGLDEDLVGNTVPDKSKWVGKGFVRHRVVGGTRHNHLPQFQPVVQIDCYACSGSSGNYRPAWNEANAMAELIHRASKDDVENFYSEQLHRELTLPSQYSAFKVRMIGVFGGGEPQPLDSDGGEVARFRFDMRFIWAVMP